MEISGAKMSWKKSEDEEGTFHAVFFFLKKTVGIEWVREESGSKSVGVISFYYATRFY